jgi:hypothetical protein
VTSKTDGYTKGPDVRTDAIYICPRKLNVQSLNYYTIVIIHELAHFCGPHRSRNDFVTDHAYRREGKKFFDMSPRKALTTADCYAHLAGEAALGAEAPYQ